MKARRCKRAILTRWRDRHGRIERTVQRHRLWVQRHRSATLKLDATSLSAKHLSQHKKNLIYGLRKAPSKPSSSFRGSMSRIFTSNVAPQRTHLPEKLLQRSSHGRSYHPPSNLCFRRTEQRWPFRNLFTLFHATLFLSALFRPFPNRPGRRWAQLLSANAEPISGYFRGGYDFAEAKLKDAVGFLSLKSAI